MSRRATLRPVSLVGAVQAVTLYALFILMAGGVIGELIHGVLIGSMAFLIWRFGIVRQVLCHHLRDGMALARAARHEEALKAFARSSESWENRKRIDNLRGILLGSASRWPFRHLSRYNEAWCLVRLGHDDDARISLDTLLREQPDMGIARELRASLDPVPAGTQPPTAAPDRDDDEADWQDLLQDEPTIDPSELSDS